MEERENYEQKVKPAIDDIEIIEVSLDDVPEKDEPKNKKGNELTEKVEELASKLESETSSIKRVLYSVKLQMVLAKIQREIDIREIQEEYGKDRTERTETINDRKREHRENIADLIENIKKYEKRVKYNAEYDYDSSKFAFKESKLSKTSNVDEYIKTLRESGSDKLNRAADQIEATLEDKRYLKELKQQLKEAKGNLSKEDSRTKKQNFKSTIEEKALVTTKKLNIFDRIKNAWKGLMTGLKSEKEQRDEMKSIKNMEKEERKNIDFEADREMENEEEQYDIEVEKIKREYKEKMQSLKELHKYRMDEIDRNADEQKQEMKEKYADMKEQANVDLSQSRRAKFLEDVHFSESEQGKYAQPTDEIVEHVTGEVVDEYGKKVDDEEISI